MIEEKLEVMKKELTAVATKEKELHDALMQTQELKLKYLGAIEVLEQLKEEDKPKEEKKVDGGK
tara:strand:- start:112 stop:303 length:192 start_codon:yes stop_codon:yes gene_type:complete